MSAAPVHASFQRLLQAAGQATAHLPPSRRVVSESDLRRELALSPQKANNWKRRGVSQEGAMDAQRQFGTSATWVIDGVGRRLDPDWMDARHTSVRPSPGGAHSEGGVAQEVRDPTGEDELKPQTWEFILSGAPLPPRFTAAVPDDALAPKSPRGTEFVFSTSFAGQPDDSVVVIVQASNGRRYMRLFFAGAGDEWEARARDQAFPALHSARDGLQMVAVATFRPGGQG